MFRDENIIDNSNPLFIPHLKFSKHSLGQYPKRSQLCWNSVGKMIYLLISVMDISNKHWGTLRDVEFQIFVLIFALLSMFNETVLLTYTTKFNIITSHDIDHCVRSAGY